MLPEPVFIVGIAHRSGTNYLHQLILMHPDCMQSAATGEDFLLVASDRLIQYADETSAHFDPVWNRNSEQLLRGIESGLLNYLQPKDELKSKIVSKTPDPENANHFSTLFSKGQMILLTRNGQDLVESFTKSFNYRFEYVVRRWRMGARSILEILNNDRSNRVMLVRYEDLQPDPEQALRSVFTFLQLDPEKYDFEKARNAAVIGSSEVKQQSGAMNWQPVAKGKDFNPMGRSAAWLAFKHYRFNYLAGKESKALGYQLHKKGNSAGYFCYNFIASLYYIIHKFTYKLIHALSASGNGFKAMVNAYRKDF